MKIRCPMMYVYVYFIKVSFHMNPYFKSKIHQRGVTSIVNVQNFDVTFKKSDEIAVAEKLILADLK